MNMRIRSTAICVLILAIFSLTFVLVQNSYAGTIEIEQPNLPEVIKPAESDDPEELTDNTSVPQENRSKPRKLTGDWGEPAISDRNWTILIYMDGDSNLEEYAMKNMKDLERTFSADAKVDIVVLIDRAQGYDTSMGDWTGTRAYRVGASVREDQLDSELLHDCGELNMSSPETLAAFISAGMEKYPAPHAALIMWNHGGGWISMADDEDAPDTENGRDTMMLNDFRQALKYCAPLFPNGKLDLLLFDMCLMGQAEVITASAPFVNYMVAGAPILPALGMDYKSFASIFQSTEAGEIASEIAKLGCDNYLKNDYNFSSLTAFDLSKTDAFIEAFKTMVEKLSERVPDAWGDITRTLFFAHNYMGRGDFKNTDSSISSIDLLDWLTRMKKSVSNPPLKEIESLEAAVKGMIIFTDKGPGITFCNGLSFYAPLRGANLRANYADMDFNKRTGWLSVLNKLHESQNKEGMETPKVVSVEIGTASIKGGWQEGKALSGTQVEITPSDSVIPLSGKDEGGSWMKIIVEGKNILWGYSAVGFSDTNDPNGEYTICMLSILMDENLDLEASKNKQSEAANVTDAITPSFKDGRNELAYMVGGLTHRFFNGEMSVLVTAEFTDVNDMNHFTVEGTYSDSQTNETAVTVSVNTDFYNIVKMTATTDTGTAYVISPRPDGIFRPTLKKSGADGSLISVQGEDILWKDGIYVIFEPIPEGKYMKVAAMAESIGGSGAELMSRPVMVKANPHIVSNLRATKQGGIDKLLGRYAIIGSMPMSNGEHIMAATGAVVEIKEGVLPNGMNNILVVYEIPGEEPLTTYLNWCWEGLPFISQYSLDDKTWEFTLEERSFALLVQEGDSHYWKMISGSNASALHLIPVNNPMFSPEYLQGAWNGIDGSGLNFGNELGSYFPSDNNRKSVTGQYTVKNSIVTIASGAQQTLTLFFGLIDENTLLVTHKDSRTAVIYKKRETSTPPTITPTTQPPTPPVSSIQPQWSLDGLWGTASSGVQITMQIQGNQYQAWMNGILFESGMFQIEGNIMYVQMVTGQQFSNIIQWDSNGMSFSLTNTLTGMTIVYQRMQQ